MEAFSFCGIHTYECTGSSERYGDDAMYEALTDFSDIYKPIEELPEESMGRMKL